MHFPYLFPMDTLGDAIRRCRLCAPRFAATATAHEPRPMVWFRPHAPILVASQAPGLRVQQNGLPFCDRSGDRLRDWMGIDRTTFYDRDRLSIVPMAFCFPGYDRQGSDLPPPPVCARTWRRQVMAPLRPRLALVVGGHAIRWHLGPRDVTATVSAWRDHAPRTFPLPHPSWRNTAWLRRNPWFETDLLPHLRAAVSAALAEASGD